MKHADWCYEVTDLLGGRCNCPAGLVVGRSKALSSDTGDPVHSPLHYTQGDVECIDAIEAALGRDGFIAFLRGQILKYQWRLGHKDDPAQDAAKAHWYSDRLQKVLGDHAR